jgi:hypothetical protein
VRAQDVLNKKKQAAEQPPPPPPPPSPSAAPDASTDPYTLLGVPRSATRAEIKSAYRAKARAMHPDVSPLPGAGAAFAAIVAAYEALTDGTARTGRDGPGVDSWSEFARKPKKESARSAARAAPGARAAAAASAAVVTGSTADPDAPSAELIPEAGDVVEYPLPAAHRRGPDDTRARGLGLLVSRNMDRGDARALPPQLLDVCEVEPLAQRESGGAVWVPDALGTPCFPRLGELRALRRDAVAYSAAHDRWTITVPLSPGCAGPPDEEEIML